MNKWCQNFKRDWQFCLSTETMALRNIWIIVIIKYSFFFFLLLLLFLCRCQRSICAIFMHRYACMYMQSNLLSSIHFNSSTVHFTSVHFLRSLVVSHLMEWKSESAGVDADLANIFGALAVPVSSVIHEHGVSPFTNQYVAFLMIHLNH